MDRRTLGSVALALDLKRLQDDLSRLKGRCAGMLDVAVYDDQALLAGVCIDAGVSDAQCRIEVRVIF
jgi:hypothetical protein